MLIFPVRWDRIKDKSGSDLSLVFTPVQRALIIVVILNILEIGRVDPDSMSIGDDTDNFDSVISDLLGKLM